MGENSQSNSSNMPFIDLYSNYNNQERKSFNSSKVYTQIESNNAEDN